MNIAVIGTGYVGLVTGTCLAEIGHEVICIDKDKNKINKMENGISPIYEPGLEELMKKNLKSEKLSFTTDYNLGFNNAQVIFIAVGTPEKEDGSADLSFVEEVANEIAVHIKKNTVIVVKSTVPVGTNEKIRDIIQSNLVNNVSIEIVSNPEFLREGHAIYDTFHGDRIVIGADNYEASQFIEDIYKPLGITVFKTDIRSAEMSKYASNAFLATKISFINEIANICEKLNANVDEVAKGMGLDKRIGNQFLNAGIGYGGSCFPKDTKALVNISEDVEHDFDLLKSVIRVNNKQRTLLVEKAKERLGCLKGKKIGILGLAFKPNTDDMREAASIVVVEQLIAEGALITAYDPVAMKNAEEVLPRQLVFADILDDAIKGMDAIFILTEWDEIRHLDLGKVIKLLKNPIIFDGRNCFELEKIKKCHIEYYSVGRPSVVTSKKCV